MIYSNIQNDFEKMGYPEALVKVLTYLKNTDFNTMAPGVYEIEGKDIFAQVFDTKSKNINEAKQEFHKEYIDVQFWVSGGEYVGVAPKKTDVYVTEENEEKDLYFCVSSDLEALIKTEKGDYLVLFPEDIHRPNVTLNTVEEYRKVVVKLKLSLLNK